MSGHNQGGKPDKGSAMADNRKKRIAAILHLAEEDTKAAKLLAASQNHYAAYHCQQAAEKLVRAFLAHHNIEPGLDHHLDVLVGKLPKDEPWRVVLEPLHKHTPYATTYRYATTGGRIPTAPDPTDVSKDADRIATLIAQARSELLKA